ncbi:DUF896 domain-containing protein [Paenibacillus popilliae]|nr:DUF896 domain-containing protein [Paenibacillus popilliae]
MNMDKLIARINELARKDKSVGLNSEELAERATLREQYLVLFRQQVRNKLDSIRYVEDEEGDQNNQPGSIVH